MRAAALIPVIIAITLGAVPANAESRVIKVDPASEAPAPQPTTEADFEKYRGFMFDLSEYDGRRDGEQIKENVKHQLDMVANAGFSPKVLEFFHSIPIVASENDCLELGAGLACYGPVAPTRRRHVSLGLTVWDHDKQQWTNPDIVDLAADSGRGVIMLRPNMMQHTDDPILLHEFLHAFHGRLMSLGFDNLGIKAFYAFVGRNYKSVTARTTAWIFATSQLIAVLVPSVLPIAKWFAITVIIVAAGRSKRAAQTETTEAPPQGGAFFARQKGDRP